MSKESQKFQSEVSNFVNSFGSNNVDFIKEMALDHRTLQQNFTRLCLQWIEHVATMDYTKHSDDRNKASLDISKQIVEEWSIKHEGHNPSKYLPHI